MNVQRLEVGRHGLGEPTSAARQCFPILLDLLSSDNKFAREMKPRD
jgi:hypothetical protein